MKNFSLSKHLPHTLYLGSFDSWVLWQRVLIRPHCKIFVKKRHSPCFFPTIPSLSAPFVTAASTSLKLAKIELFLWFEYLRLLCVCSCVRFVRLISLSWVKSNVYPPWWIQTQFIQMLRLLPRSIMEQQQQRPISCCLFVGTVRRKPRLSGAVMKLARCCVMHVVCF